MLKAIQFGHHGLKWWSWEKPLSLSRQNLLYIFENKILEIWEGNSFSVISFPMVHLDTIRLPPSFTYKVELASSTKTAEINY